MRLAPLLAFALLAPAAGAQHEHAHPHGDAERLGTVVFPTSCRSEVAAEFTRAVALLHSFGYEEARRGFEVVAARDPLCGMAQWGRAMTYYHPIWAPPTPAELAEGRTAAEKAAELGAKTKRERAYIDAIGVFYRDTDRLQHSERAQAMRRAMEDLSRRFPDDDEAAIFHGLALLATAAPSDATLSNQKAAAAIFNRLLPRHRDHPGIAHYVIHSFDYPSLARDALPAARAYARIAPSSAHALHMPSHIFTRLGLWQESIASNLDSAAAARRLVAKIHPGADSFDALHALDYLEYAYLQIGDDLSAREVVEEAARAKTFDDPNFAAAYALAAIPARWTLERRDWRAAAALELPDARLAWPEYRYVTAITPFAQALGAARSGQLERARASLAKLRQIHAELLKAPAAGTYDWAGNVESMRLAVAAWLAHAEGRGGEAFGLARAAADLDEKTGKHPVTPGSILPPRELLGDLLMEADRHAEALEAYAASLRDAPSRFNSLYGGARAAELAGNEERATELYRTLLETAVEKSARPEIRHAKQLVSQRR